MLEGQPKRVIQPLNKARLTVSAVISSIGITSGHFVNLSMIVRQYIFPSDGGKGPIKSMCKCENLASGVANVPKGVLVDVVLLRFQGAKGYGSGQI